MRWLVFTCVSLFFLVGRGAALSRAQDAETGESTPKPVPSGSTATSGSKPTKRSRKGHAQGEQAAAPHEKQPKEIYFPLTEKEPAKNVKIPETDAAGIALSVLMAAEITRLDNEHVQIKEMNMDLNHPDGKEDFHIMMPTSIFNLKTRIITSEDPVTVKTQDFELTGEKMEFNTVERTGRLIGKVRMLVHNLKQVAGQGEPMPKPE